MFQEDWQNASSALRLSSELAKEDGLDTWGKSNLRVITNKMMYCFELDIGVSFCSINPTKQIQMKYIIFYSQIDYCLSYLSNIPKAFNFCFNSCKNKQLFVCRSGIDLLQLRIVIRMIIWGEISPSWRMRGGRFHGVVF